MHEAGLGKVMSRVETAPPAALSATASTAKVDAHKKLADVSDEQNGKLTHVCYW